MPAASVVVSAKSNVAWLSSRASSGIPTAMAKRSDTYWENAIP